MDPLRSPNLAADIGDIERRLKVVEFGDPYDVNSRIADIPGTVKSLVDPALQTTYTNDGYVSNYTYNLIVALNDWVAVLRTYINSRADWNVKDHEYRMHSTGVPPGTAPTLAYPAWPQQPSFNPPTIIIP